MFTVFFSKSEKYYHWNHSWDWFFFINILICAKLEEEFLHLPFIWKTVCIFIFFLEFDEQSKNDKWKEKEGEKKEKSQMWCGGYPSVMSVYIYIYCALIRWERMGTWCLPS